MSQVGATITIDDLDAGASWALIANSAIDGGADGIMAGSPDIVDVIQAGEIDLLCIFPSGFAPGFVLWTGTLENALSGEGGKWEQLHPDSMQHWIDDNNNTAQEA